MASISKRPSSPLSGRPLLSLDTASNRPLAPQHQHWSAAPSEGYVDSPAAVSLGPSPFPTAFPSRGDAAEGRPAARPESAAVSQRIFTELDRIKGLQEEIVAEHQKLEGIGGSDWASWVSSKGKEGLGGEEGNKGLGGTAGKSKEDKEKSSKTSESMASYEKMAESFSERQEGIEHIMQKLSSLSSALKEFHALPSPVLFPSNNRSSQPPRSRAAATAASSTINGQSDSQGPLHAASSRVEHRLSR